MNANDLRATLALLSDDLKQRMIPGSLERPIVGCLSKLNGTSKRNAIVLLRMLKSINDDLTRAVNMAKLLDDSLDRDARRIEAIEHDEKVREKP